MNESSNEMEGINAVEFMKRFLPDHVATAEDLRDIEIAREEYAKGETTSHDDIDWD